MKASETAIKIIASITGMADVEALKKSLGTLQSAAKSAQEGIRDIVKSNAFKAAAVSAAALTTAIVLSAKAAIDFESSMADVRKVVEGIETPQAFAEISQEIIELSKQMPITAQGFADIYAAAGQAGIARDQLKEFATQVAQVAVAFDMTATEAGTAMAKLQTSLGLSLPQVRDLTDAMNHLSNNTASSASEIIDFTLRAGQAGRSAGLTAEQTSAFGAAMIASGSSAEVAATSFNNMIKTLSRGPSMTERQIDALTRLGYEQSDATVNEQRYTQAVQLESEKRIEAARHETNQLAKELNRRFRDQMQTIQDNLDDEAEAYQNAIQDRVDAQIKGLQREQEARMNALRERAEASGVDITAQIYAIRDEYDARIDAIRDAAQRELKARRRLDRDRLQDIRDNMDDRKEAELAALEANFKETQAKEKQLMEERVAQIKAQAEAGATAAAEALAKGLQENAIGTITEVFDRIRELSKETQLSVISDLFGDEAKAILPLINNVELLEKAMGLVGDKTQYAGSTLEEFLARSATTANEMQLANNNLQALSITFGQQFVPALNGLLQVFTPVIGGFTWMVENIPGLGTALAVLTTAFVGLVAILPALGGLAQIVTAFGGFSATFAAITGAISTVVAALTGSGGLLAALAAVFTGPVGWAVLLVAAGVAIYAFRDQIGDALKAIGQFFVDAFDAIGDLLKTAAQAYVDFYVKPVLNFAKDTVKGILDLFGKIPEAIKQPFINAANAIKSIFRNILQFLVSALNSWISRVNYAINIANRLGASIPNIPTVSMPEFAAGGVVTNPTVALVGEKEREYIIPESKMARASANYLSGMRGGAVIPAFASGGVVGGRGGMGAGNTTVQINTGPVLQQDGQRYVTIKDLENALKDFGTAVFSNARTPGGRRYQGVRA